MVTSIVLVFLGGFIGAISRDLIITHYKKRANAYLGTFVVNVLGSFLLGAFSVILSGNHPFLLLTVGTGVVGAFTTFSTFSMDALQLSKENKIKMSLYIVSTIVVCVFSFSIGLNFLQFK